jgi:hypothetical protein
MTRRTNRTALAALATLVAAAMPWGSGARAQETEKPAVITDKTLVAWVCPADLAQRGGSLITLIDKAERFDAIVLGEIAPAAWMAGSDFFRRTHKDQSAWPAESAGPTTTVAIAITYRGDRITLYRNGTEYAAYTIDQPQPFGDDAMVLIGLRYIGAMGEIGFFAGAIDDVRIYDLALSAEQIAALVPNQPSDPRPRAWWTFEDGTAEDAMKTFRACRIEGGARIVRGMLVLDGSGYVWAAKDPKLLAAGEEEETPFDTSVQTMFYQPRSKRTGALWDTWLYFHEGTYYLYYLARARGQWDNISMARSPDGVHWKEIGRVLSKGRGVTWMGTGSTWKSPAFEKDATFFMNFSEWKGPRQTIFFAASKDLVHWTRLGNEHEFVQDERWYERNGRWDCIWTIARPGGGLYGYWTATPKSDTGGRFGFGETHDGVTWRALKPPAVAGVGEGEVGAIQKIGSRYYLMFGTGGIMVTLVADRPEGPFRAAPTNLHLLSGHTYFSRFFPMLDGLLVNHHSIARDGQVYFGTLKTAILDDAGTLRLGWWKGNEAIKRERLAIDRPRAAADGPRTVTMLDTTFDVARGIILEGSLPLPETPEAPRRGLFIECAQGSGAAILVDAAGTAAIGPIKTDGSDFSPEKTVDRAMRFGNPARFRLILKGSLVEFYLDDILVECYSLPAGSSGRIGLFSGGAPDFAAGLQAWSG